MTSEIVRAFTEAARRNGYDDVQVEVFPFRDLKVKWTRAYKWISFEVSDYLADMPADVADDMAESIMARIRGDMVQGYPESVNGWLTSPEFIRNHRTAYLSRFHGFSEHGEHVNVNDVVDWIKGAGLDIPDDVIIGWGMGPTRSSILFRVVKLDRRLDNPDVDLEDVARELYRELCRIELGFGNQRDAEALKRLTDRFEEACE